MLFNMLIISNLHSSNKSEISENNFFTSCLNIMSKIYNFVQTTLTFIQKYIPLDIIIIGFVVLINFKLMSIGILMSAIYMLALVIFLYYTRYLFLYQNILLKIRNTDLNFPFKEIILQNLDIILYIIISILYIYIIVVLNLILTLILSIFFWIIIAIVIIILLYAAIEKLHKLFKIYSKK